MEEGTLLGGSGGSVSKRRGGLGHQDTYQWQHGPRWGRDNCFQWILSFPTLNFPPRCGGRSRGPWWVCLNTPGRGPYQVAEMSEEEDFQQEVLWGPQEGSGRL